MKKIISHLITLLIVISSLNCIVKEQKEFIPLPSDGTGTLILNLPKVQNKISVPNLDMHPVNYIIKGFGPVDSTFELTTSEETNTIAKLLFGQWTIKVDALNAEGIPIAYGEEGTTIMPGPPSTVSVIVSPLNGFGYLDLSIHWEDGIFTDSPKIVASITGIEGIPIPIDFVIDGNLNKATLFLTRSAGYYELTILVYDAQSNSYGGRSFVVRVLEAQTTPDDFYISTNQEYGYNDNYINIVNNMYDPINIQLSGQEERLFTGEEMTITATALNETEALDYTWKLNGHTIGTSNTITLGSGLPEGPYNLDLVVFTKDRLRAGDAYHSFVISAPAVPSAPVLTEVVPLSASSINITWADSSDIEDGFILERSASPDFIDIIPMDLVSDTVSFLDTGLNYNTVYYYRIKAYNTIGESAYSNVISAATNDIFPDAPDGLNALTVSSSQIDLSWNDNSDNEDGFRIERTTPGNSFSAIAYLPANSTYYQDLNLMHATQYIYRITAYNGIGISGYSDEASGTTLDIIPLAPSGLSVEAISSSQINLTWFDNSGNEDGFKIERMNLGGSFSVIATTSSDTVSYQDTGLNPDTQYIYRITAYNEIGDSPYTSEVSGTTPDIIPQTPDNLLATVVSSSQIDLSWTDTSDNEDGFIIERMTYGGSYEIIADLPAGTVYYYDNSLQPDTQYFYRIYSYNGIGNSDYSDEDSGTTLDVIPLAPSTLAANAVSSNQINLSWIDNSDNEDGFIIERAISGNSFSVIADISADAISYQDINLSPATQYIYRISAYNEIGNSTASNEASGTTLETIPNAPDGLNAATISNNQIDLTWNDNSDNENGFTLERALDSGFTLELATYDLSSGTTFFSDTGLSDDTTYYYRIKASNNAGSSAYSITSAQTAVPNNDANLILSMNFDNNLDDSSDNEHSAQWVGPEMYTPGIFNQALDLNNVNENYVMVDHDDTLGGMSSLTISIWAKKNAPSIGGTIILKHTQYRIYINSNYIQSYVGNSDSVFGSAEIYNFEEINNNNWHHYALTYDGLEIKLYVDSIFVTSAALTGVVQNSSYYDLLIGRYPWDGIPLFDGQIDELKIYNRALDQDDITYLYTENTTTSTGDENPPANPSNLSATNASGNTVQLTWDDNSDDETLFSIERRTPETAFTEIATCTVDETTYQDTGLEYDKTYLYRIRAYNDYGASGYSNEATVTILPLQNSAIIINHNYTDISLIPGQWIEEAKTSLHIAYEHTSHGSQLITGMNALMTYPLSNPIYNWIEEGGAGLLDLDDNFSGLYCDLGYEDIWPSATRDYLNDPLNADVNVVIWSWCDIRGHDIAKYLNNMEALIAEYGAGGTEILNGNRTVPVTFVFMTGHTNGEGETGETHISNQTIRQHCIDNNRVLYDFYDIEIHNPDSDYFGDKLVTDNCDYDSNGDTTIDSNWAVEWINNNPTSEMTQIADPLYCGECAHSQRLNCVIKGSSAWALWARIAGWDGQ